MLNLFDFVEVHGTVKGFVGKAFFEEPSEVFVCKVCEKEVHGVKRFTCSRECARIYAKQKKRENPFVKTGRTEYGDIIAAKYGSRFT